MELAHPGMWEAGWRPVGPTSGLVVTAGVEVVEPGDGDRDGDDGGGAVLNIVVDDMRRRGRGGGGQRG